MDVNNNFDVIMEILLGNTGVEPPKELKGMDAYQFVKWMSEPVQKKKFQLSRMELDVLDVQDEKRYTFYNVPFLLAMQKKGYFKNVPDNMSINEVLANSELDDD